MSIDCEDDTAGGGSGADTDVVSFTDCDTGETLGECQASIAGMSSDDLADQDITDFRGVSIGTNNGPNFYVGGDLVEGGTIPQVYTQWLADIHANWVMIPVAVMYDGSGVPESVYIEHPPNYAEGGDERTWTYEPEALAQLVYQLKNNNDVTLKVGISIQLEPDVGDDSDFTAHKCRWIMGRDTPPSSSTSDPEHVCGTSAEWFWDASDSSEQAAIDAFWDSYITSVETIIGWSASAGATPDLIVLGTETDSLLRTDAYWEPRIAEMITTVRSATSSWSPNPGLTVAYGPQVFLNPSAFPGTATFFTDESLDYVGVTAYFPLFDESEPDPTGPHSRCTYESRWTRNLEVIGEYWVRDTTRPVLITELGLPNSTSAPYAPSSGGDERIEEYASGQTLVEDGDETQGNAVWAYLRSRSECNDVAAGQFLWDNQIAGGSEWNDLMQGYRHAGVRWFEDASGHTVDYSNDIVAEAYSDSVWAYSRAPTDGPGSSPESPQSPGAAESGAGR